MGRCESASVSVGMKIKLSDLISYITKKNLKFCQDILQGGVIEDCNGELNSMYENIMNQDDHLELPFEEYKEWVTTQLKNSLIPYDPSQSLYDRYLLYGTKSLLETSRWGYGREGTNSSSTDMLKIQKSIRKDLSQRYKRIPNSQYVFILYQSSS